MTVPVSGAVVVGYDASEPSKIAVEWAAADADRRGVDLVVVHAARRLKGRDDAGGDEGADAIAEEGAERARERAPGLTVHAVARKQGPAAALQELSADAAVVVVGHRGRGRLAAGLVGSVAFTISAHAQCPVLVIRGNSEHLPGPDRPVVVGTDDSEFAAQAVAGAARLAASTDARLIIAAAWDVPEANPWSAAYLANVNATEDAAHAAETEAVATVERAREAVLAEHPGLTVEVGTQRGRPEHVLADASEGAGVLVVGSRGHSDLVGLLLGSVSRAVLHTANCPVAVIR